MEALMKFQLTTGWFVGQFLIPPGTQIDNSQAQWAWVGNGIPPDVVALDQQTYDYLVSGHGVNGISYPYWQVRYATGINPIHP
jgi:hypothetical protein